jgi:hypothetical protein
MSVEPLTSSISGVISHNMMLESVAHFALGFLTISSCFHLFVFDDFVTNSGNVFRYPVLGPINAEIGQTVLK